jgi:hypothetical protein
VSSGIAGHNLPRITTWAQAEKRFNTITPWRGYAPDYPIRPLTKNRGDHEKVIVRHEYDGRVAYSCRYHNTDCITFNGDGTITLIPWASGNTDTFVESILGYHTLYNSPLGMCVPSGQGQGVYKLSDAGREGYTIREGSHTLLDIKTVTEDIPHYAVNRKLANAQYKAYGLPAMGVWVKAALAMAPHVFPRSGYGTSSLDEATLARCADQEEWMALAKEYGANIMPRARAGVLELHGECITRTDLPYLDDYGQLMVCVRSAKDYESTYDRAEARAKHQAWLTSITTVPATSAAL